MKEIAVTQWMFELDIIKWQYYVRTSLTSPSVTAIMETNVSFSYSDKLIMVFWHNHKNTMQQPNYLHFPQKWIELRRPDSMYHCLFRINSSIQCILMWLYQNQNIQTFLYYFYFYIAWCILGIQCMVCWKFSFFKTSPSGAQLTRFIVMAWIHVIPCVNDIAQSKTLQQLDDIPRWEIMPSVQRGIFLVIETVAETFTYRIKTLQGSFFGNRIKIELGRWQLFLGFVGFVWFVCMLLLGVH